MATSIIPPARRPELIVRPLGDAGQFVIKDPQSGGFFNVGQVEAFLLAQLDGVKTVAEVCAAFESQFNEPLSAEELDEFIELAKTQGFLKRSQTTQPAAATTSSGRQRLGVRSVLYWRRSMFDPNRLLTWLAPKMDWVWSRGFLLTSLVIIVAAAIVFWTSRHALFGSLGTFVRWDALAMVWFTILVVTALHELAHGLTCKHYGGEVHEVGVLMLFFMPCMFCNVSDAWLFREKSKRLWVSLAGGYCDLCIWALAVFVWRLTQPGIILNQLAWVVLSVCGVRVFLNFNPFLKLDGYYLISDWMDLPNLRRRSIDYVLAHLRWLLWGAERPAVHPQRKFLLGFGVTTWTFGVIYLVLIFLAVFGLVSKRLGVAGMLLVPLIVMVRSRRYLRGFIAGEVYTMIKTRPVRRSVWLCIVAGVPIFLFTWHIEDRATGTFHIRPASRAELRAPVSGFLQSVYCDEGQPVTLNSIVGRIEIPDLTSKLAQKRSEMNEAQAKLRLLEAGSRKEEILEGRNKVTRAKEWRDLAKIDLERKRKVLHADLDKLAKEIAKASRETEYQSAFLQRAKGLLEKQALASEKYIEAEKQLQINQLVLDQALAQRKARLEQGTLEDENELAKREKDLCDAQSILVLLEAGTRPEEIEAQRAHLARLQEESRYLETMQTKLDLRAAVSGVIITPFLREKVGQYFKEGDLICEIQNLDELEAEIPLEEQEVAAVQPGQLVVLKVRALPFDTFEGKVDRIAPAAVKNEKNENQATLTIGCRIENATAEVRPGMTGYARIYTTPRSIGAVVIHRVLRYLRTEFWW